MWVHVDMLGLFWFHRVHLREPTQLSTHEPQLTLQSFAGIEINLIRLSQKGGA